MSKRGAVPEESGKQWINVMYTILLGGALAGAVAVLSLLFCAFLVSVGTLPVSCMAAVVLSVCVLGALAGSIYAVRRCRPHSFLSAFGVGIVLFLLLLTAGMLAYEEASIANGGGGILCACLCGSAIPGILARNPKKKRRR